MNQHIYSAQDIAELTEQAEIARKLDAEWREVSAAFVAVIDRVVGPHYLGWEVNYSERADELGLENLTDLILASQMDFTTAPFQYIPRIGEFAIGRNIRKAAEWAKLNRRCAKEIAKARRVIANHS